MADLPEPEHWIEALARLMDRAIPLGGRFGIGLDGILGVVPGVGDLAGGLVACLLIFHAHRRGVPRPTLLRMVANVGIDTALGSVPVFGDVFDIVFQANIKNLELYRAALRGERRLSKDWWFLSLLLAGILVLSAVPAILIIWLLSRLNLT